MALWLLALAVVIVGGILLVTKVVGHWVLLVGGLIVLGLGLMRYRAEADQKKQNILDEASK